MKRILVTAGGTATAWHIVNVAEQYFKEKLEIFACDSNEPYLVPASTKAKKCFLVPVATDLKYSDIIGKIINSEEINCIIPLIPIEAYLFANDSDFIKRHKIVTTAPVLETIEMLADKRKMYSTLKNLCIPTPEVFELKDVSEKQLYLLKPRLGFGSKGLECILGRELKINSSNYDLEHNVIQEYCHDTDYDEVTVEIYNGKAGLYTFARRRVSAKDGVCVKMEPVDNSIFVPYIKRIVEQIHCPKAFNVQFLFHHGEWKLYDCNLRLGAGTALSSAAGFKLTQALLCELADIPVTEELFAINHDIKSVVRVYQEIVIK